MSSAAAAALEMTARDRAGPADLPPRGNAVYLHQLYRDPAAAAAPPPPQQPLIHRELMFFFGVLKWCTLLFIAVASFSFVMWMIFHPNFPLLTVASAAMSSFTISATAAVGECNITLVLTNPNRHLTTVYDHMEISLLYDSQKVLLSQLHHPLIVQPRRSRITLQSNLNFSGVNLGSSVVSAMKQDLDRGTLGLGINISAVLKYRNGTWKTKSRYMRAYCGGVSFGFTSINKPGIFLNPYQECEVYVFSK